MFARCFCGVISCVLSLFCSFPGVFWFSVVPQVISKTNNHVILHSGHYELVVKLGSTQQIKQNIQVFDLYPGENKKV